MRPRPQGQCQSGVAGNDQRETTGPADTRDSAAEHHSAGFAVMAQHHTREAGRETRYGTARVRQAPSIGEQP